MLVWACIVGWIQTQIGPKMDPKSLGLVGEVKTVGSWPVLGHFLGYLRHAKWAVLGLGLGPNKRHTKNKNKIQQNRK